jgi:hypothetical protein
MEAIDGTNEWHLVDVDSTPLENKKPIDLILVEKFKMCMYKQEECTLTPISTSSSTRTADATPALDSPQSSSSSSVTTPASLPCITKKLVVKGKRFDEYYYLYTLVVFFVVMLMLNYKRC